MSEQLISWSNIQDPKTWGPDDPDKFMEIGPEVAKMFQKYIDEMDAIQCGVTIAAIARFRALGWWPSWQDRRK